MAKQKIIRSSEQFLKALKSNSLLSFQGRFYMSDFHKTTVSVTVVREFDRRKLLEVSSAAAKWFEVGFKLKFEYRKCKSMAEVSKKKQTVDMQERIIEANKMIKESSLFFSEKTDRFGYFFLDPKERLLYKDKHNEEPVPTENFNRYDTSGICQGATTMDILYYIRNFILVGAFPENFELYFNKLKADSPKPKF